MQKLIDEFGTLCYPQDRFITNILPVFRIEAFQRPTLLLSHGQVQSSLYLVRKGYVRVFRKDSKGRKVHRAFVGEGKWASVPTSFIRREQSQEYIEVCRHSEVYAIAYENYDLLFRQDGLFSMAAQLLLVKLVEAADKREDLFRLADPVSKRLDVVLENAPNLQDYASQKDIADFALVSPSTVSRYRARNRR